MKNGLAITFQTEAWAFQRVKDAANSSQRTPKLTGSFSNSSLYLRPLFGGDFSLGREKYDDI